MKPPPKCPCTECRVHSGICYVFCKAYKEWAVEKRKYNEAASAKKRVEVELIRQQIEGKERIYKKRGSRKW